MTFPVSAPSFADTGLPGAPDLVLWCGPVSAKNLASVRWRRPTEVIVVNQGIGTPDANGNRVGSSHFANLAASLGPRPLAAIAAQRGHPLESVGRVAVLGFSAAHGLIEGILRSEDAHRVRILGAFDAYYTNASRAVKPGYLAFCERACEGDAVALVTTSSTAGRDHPSGSDSFSPVLAELHGRFGPLEERDLSLESEVPIRGRRGFFYADYGGLKKHVSHATELAPLWTERLLAPALAGSGSVQGGEGGGGDAFAIAVLGGLLWWMLA